MIVLILTITAVIFSLWGIKNYIWDGGFTCTFIAIISICTLVFEFVAIIIANVGGTKSFVEQAEFPLQILEIQVKDAIEHEEDKKELLYLYHAVKNYNSSILIKKELTYSPFVGIFFNNGYDELEPVDLSQLKEKIRCVNSNQGRSMSVPDLLEQNFLPY